MDTVIAWSLVSLLTLCSVIGAQEINATNEQQHPRQLKSATLNPSDELVNLPDVQNDLKSSDDVDVGNTVPFGKSQSLGLPFVIENDSISSSSKSISTSPPSTSAEHTDGTWEGRGFQSASADNANPLYKVEISYPPRSVSNSPLIASKQLFKNLNLEQAAIDKILAEAPANPIYLKEEDCDPSSPPALQANVYQPPGIQYGQFPIIQQQDIPQYLPFLNVPDLKPPPPSLLLPQEPPTPERGDQEENPTEDKGSEEPPTNLPELVYVPKPPPSYVPENDAISPSQTPGVLYIPQLPPYLDFNAVAPSQPPLASLPPVIAENDEDCPPEKIQQQSEGLQHVEFVPQSPPYYINAPALQIPTQSPTQSSDSDEVTIIAQAPPETPENPSEVPYIPQSPPFFIQIPNYPQYPAVQDTDDCIEPIQGIPPPQSSVQYIPQPPPYLNIPALTPSFVQPFPSPSPPPQEFDKTPDAAYIPQPPPYLDIPSLPPAVQQLQPAYPTGQAPDDCIEPQAPFEGSDKSPDAIYIPPPPPYLNYPSLPAISQAPPQPVAVFPTPVAPQEKPEPPPQLSADVIYVPQAPPQIEYPSSVPIPQPSPQPPPYLDYPSLPVISQAPPKPAAVFPTSVVPQEKPEFPAPLSDVIYIPQSPPHIEYPSLPIPQPSPQPPPYLDYPSIPAIPQAPPQPVATVFPTPIIQQEKPELPAPLSDVIYVPQSPPHIEYPSLAVVQPSPQPQILHDTVPTTIISSALPIKESKPEPEVLYVPKPPPPFLDIPSIPATVPSSTEQSEEPEKQPEISFIPPPAPPSKPVDDDSTTPESPPKEKPEDCAEKSPSKALTPVKTITQYAPTVPALIPIYKIKPTVYGIAPSIPVFQKTQKVIPVKPTLIYSKPIAYKLPPSKVSFVSNYFNALKLGLKVKKPDGTLVDCAPDANIPVHPYYIRNPRNKPRLIKVLKKFIGKKHSHLKHTKFH